MTVRTATRLLSPAQKRALAEMHVGYVVNARGNRVTFATACCLEKHGHLTMRNVRTGDTYSWVVDSISTNRTTREA
jgi:hypothetical protein